MTQKRTVFTWIMFFLIGFSAYDDVKSLLKPSPEYYSSIFWLITIGAMHLMDLVLSIVYIFKLYRMKDGFMRWTHIYFGGSFFITIIAVLGSVEGGVKDKFFDIVGMGLVLLVVWFFYSRHLKKITTTPITQLSNENTKKPKTKLRLFSLSKDDLEYQITNYHSLSMWRSSRKQLGLFNGLIVLLSMSLVTPLVPTLSTFGLVSIVAELLMYGILGFYVYQGRKWAIVSSAGLYTLSKIILLLSLFASPVKVIASILFLVAYLHMAFIAWKVEDEREQNKSTGDSVGGTDLNSEINVDAHQMKSKSHGFLLLFSVALVFWQACFRAAAVMSNVFYLNGTNVYEGMSVWLLYLDLFNIVFTLWGLWLLLKFKKLGLYFVVGAVVITCGVLFVTSPEYLESINLPVFMASFIPYILLIFVFLRRYNYYR